ncbi:hypothetical protein EDB81DRAFT_869912 [Dactylonectria macrodidyma]|uniref:Uncharacterized protein n=1 Tax=Dactylonectria macrodidyma TaxID=307937 RepID=A0A9P9ES75_9HYPO|nr:hypothetical protein EDB81DRAFT_869912 [Dactylonectria macrodidyma]
MEQIFQDAKKTLYPRLALYEAIAKYKGEHERRRPASDRISEIRRDFLDSSAYLCDIEKGGATVTAAGLQKLPYSNILCLAANEGIRSAVKSYANDLRDILVNMNSETEVKAREEVFQRAIYMCSPRLAFYKEELRTYATRCRMELRKELPDDSVSSLRNKLKKLSEPRVSFNLARIVDLCYDMRGREVDAIKKRSINSKDNFGSLAHYIGRLGATRSPVNTVVRAMSQVPSLRKISDIRVMDVPEVRRVTLSAEDMVPYEIVWKISKDSVSQNTLAIQSALHNLIYLDPPSGVGSDNPVRIVLSARRTIQTRVHAELQIGDFFSHQSLDFVDGDKYIGCSKPACYFCYIWLISHNYRYVQPATHSKILPGCRGPDKHIDESSVAILKDMYKKIILRVGQDILDFLLNERNDEAAGRRHHYMSTEGTSRATSII